MASFGRRLGRNILEATKDVARELREALDESLAEECRGSDDDDDGDDDGRRAPGLFSTSHDLSDI